MAATRTFELLDQLTVTEGVNAALVAFVRSRTANSLASVVADVASLMPSESANVTAAIAAYDPTAWTTIAPPVGAASRKLTSSCDSFEIGALPRTPELARRHQQGTA